MEGCWAEDPAERPDFSHIKIYMAKLNKWVPLYGSLFTPISQPAQLQIHAFAYLKQLGVI